MRAVCRVQETGLQRYLSDALRRSGKAVRWDEYLLELRRIPLSYQSVACEVYRELGLTIDATTLKRWLRGLERDASLELTADADLAGCSR